MANLTLVGRQIQAERPDIIREPRSLEWLLSPARMAPYVDASRGSWDDALTLYDWNARIGAAFFESIHYLEVGLRNAMDAAATATFGVDWLSQSAGVLTPQSQKSVLRARGHAGGSAAPRGKLIAELPFGFWWSLLADEYNRRLWQPSLQNAFEGAVRRRRLHADLDGLRILRNRIAHHEPIHGRDLSADYTRLETTARRVGAALGEHIAVTSRVPTLLTELALP